VTAFNRRAVQATYRKELRDFRRNRSLVVGMSIIPIIFSVQPLVQVFTLTAAASIPLRHEHVLLYMLAIPALTPSFIAAYSVVGERQQGTLEPVLTTPIRSRELLLGKAFATLVPSVGVAYLVFAIFVALVEVFAQRSVADALIRPPDLLAQLVFTPLLAGWSIWIAVLISARTSDVRVAQQFATLASLPSIALTVIISLNVITPSLRTAVIAGIALLALNRVGWRLASASFDRERLITGTK
jgi:ABC-2 type transport system permease protein